MKFYFLSLLWILSISGLLVIAFNKKFGFVCTLTLIIGSLLLYLFGFINNIKLGFGFSWVFVFAFIVIILYWVIKKKNEKLKKFIENYFTIGFYAFIILCIYSFFLFCKQGFSNCDEFTHWGPMVIATLKSNGFYSVTDSLLTFHKDYPPLFTLIEVLFCGFNRFKFSETICYIALTIFNFSCFMPMLEKLDIKNKKDWIKGLISIFGILLVNLTISKTTTAQEYAFVYNSIYTDWPLAIFATYLLFNVFVENDWNKYIYTLLTIGLSSLLLMKQMGICFFLIVLFYAFIKIWLVDKKLNKKRLIKGIVCFAIIPLVAYFSWQYIIDLYELKGQFVISDFNFAELLRIKNGTTEFPWKTETLWYFIHEIINRPLVLHPFGMSFFIFVLLVTILVLVICRFNRNSIALSLSYVIGAGGYVCTMLILYLIAFDKYEAPRLASFDRYMNTYLYMGTTLVLMISIYINSCKNHRAIRYLAVVLILCLFVEPGNLKQLKPRFKIEDEPMKVMIINQFNDYKLEREDLNGLRFEFNPVSHVTKETFSEKDWYNYLYNNDLMYVVDYDDYIFVDLWRPMNQEDYLFDNTLYSIEKNDGNINLRNILFQYYDYVVRYYMMEKNFEAES